MSSELYIDVHYRNWLTEIKGRIKSSQIKASVMVNHELIALYWHLGAEISEKQKKAVWGDKLIEALSTDLTDEFSDIKGFSRSNLFNIRKWYQFYSQDKAIVQQAVGLINPLKTGIFSEPYYEINQQAVDQNLLKLFSLVPWGHHVLIITKIKNIEESLFYLMQTIQNNWSRNVLAVQIETRLYQRQGKAITNFSLTLPTPDADLAREMLKNPYNFDFLNLTKEAEERELEKALIEHIKKFLLELGRGFAYVGNQYKIKVSDDDFYLDMLFYNFKLKCFVVFELKIGDFKPEYAGKLNFYINAVNELVKDSDDKPTIGVLLCKTPNKTTIELALKGIQSPLGVAEYELVKAIPETLKGEMPTIEELENELRAFDIKEKIS